MSEIRLIKTYKALARNGDGDLVEAIWSGTFDQAVYMQDRYASDPDITVTVSPRRWEEQGGVLLEVTDEHREGGDA